MSEAANLKPMESERVSIPQWRQLTPVSLLQWVWRAYFRTALMPLLLVEVVLIIIYLTANQLGTEQNIAAARAIATDELRRLTQREAMVIQKQLQAISQATDLFRRQAALALQTPFEPTTEERARYADSPEGAYYTTRDNGGAAVFYSGLVKIGAEQRDKVWRTTRLDPLMRDLQQTHPLVVQIYLNTHDSLNRIYPYFEVLTQYRPLLDIPSFNFYYEADAKHNPQRGVVWTDVYVDPAGQGWLASCIAPVYRGDFLEGVVGLDITVATITDTILNLAIPWQGYGMLVGKTGTLLALPQAGEADWGLRELTTHTYTDLIRQDTFKPEAFNIAHHPGLAVLQQQAEGVVTLELNGPQLAAWATIPETGWKLLVLVRENAIYAEASALGKRLLWIGLWMIAGILLFYGIFFIVLYRRAQRMARSIAEPLEAIDSLVDRIGQGHYHQVAPDSQVAELQKTAQGLVAMGEQLGAANQQLQTAQQEAEQARDMAQEASRLKSEFLAMVSHELRTPLNGVLGMLDLLLNSTLDSRQRKYALTARQSGQALLRLIEDLLGLSEVEAGRVELTHSPFLPLTLVESVVDILAPKAYEKRLNLMAYVDPKTPTQVSGDGGRLRQILLNLVGNAVKFTARGEIAIRCEPDQRVGQHVWLNFKIIDTGIGIPASARNRLFLPFTQVDSSPNRRFGGVGMGLVICKRLVELMGGEIGVDSVQESGSTFWFRVPLDLVKDELTPPPRIRSGLARRVLVVEPSRYGGELLQDYMSHWGMSPLVVTTAAAALAALNSAREAPFAIIVLCLDLDSIELAQLLPPLEQLSSLPRLLLASQNESTLDARAQALGFDAWLTKPVHRSRLFECLVGLIDIPTAVEPTMQRPGLPND